MARTVAALAEAVAAPKAIGAAPEPAPEPIAAHQAAPAIAQRQGEILPPTTTKTPASGQPGPRRDSGSRAQHRARRPGHLRASVWQPLAVFTGALWLRVTGTFFALIALTMGMAAWRQRGEWRTLHSSAASHLWVLAACTALFGYFALSSFVRAAAKERSARPRPSALQNL